MLYFNMMIQNISRRIKATSQHFFLLGPRGTGKTTWLINAFPDAVIIDLLDPGIFREYITAPERLESLTSANKDSVIVIDEIQRVPGLLPTVHRCIDKKIAKQFILTGSSARKLRRADVDLLGGRAAPKEMHPFMAAELKEQFSLETSLQLGMLPLVLGASDPSSVLKGYVGIYLEQEIKAEAAVRSVESFARFLEALSFSQASVLNLSNIARESQVRRSTVTSYLEIAQELLIAGTLPVFSRRAGRVASTHPKFFYFDCGVYRSLRPSGPLDRGSEIDGVALETLVYQHLKAWIDNGDNGSRLYFWRTLSGMEVDFVIYGEETFFAIEVKNSTRVRPEDLRGLAAFTDDYPEAKAIVLYRGDQRLKLKNVLAIPVLDFLKKLSPEKPLSEAIEP
jgi:predicted AAA+ superfamily ATPase